MWIYIGLLCNYRRVISSPPASDPTLHQLASDLVVLSSRLTRAVRREVEHPAGARALSILDELGPTGVTALAVADRCSQPTMTARSRSWPSRGW